MNRKAEGMLLAGRRAALAAAASSARLVVPTVPAPSHPCLGRTSFATRTDPAGKKKRGKKKALPSSVDLTAAPAFQDPVAYVAALREFLSLYLPVSEVQSIFADSVIAPLSPSPSFFPALHAMVPDESALEKAMQHLPAPEADAVLPHLLPGEAAAQKGGVDAVSRYTQVVAPLLLRASEAYYGGPPVLPDWLFDLVLAEAEALEVVEPWLGEVPGAPTHSVGAPVDAAEAATDRLLRISSLDSQQGSDSGLAHVAHRVPMLSLTSTFTPSAVVRFAKSAARAFYKDRDTVRTPFDAHVHEYGAGVAAGCGARALTRKRHAATARRGRVPLFTPAGSHGSTTQVAVSEGAPRDTALLGQWTRSLCTSHGGLVGAVEGIPHAVATARVASLVLALLPSSTTPSFAPVFATLFSPRIAGSSVSGGAQRRGDVFHSEDVALLSARARALAPWLRGMARLRGLKPVTNKKKVPVSVANHDKGSPSTLPATPASAELKYDGLALSLSLSPGGFLSTALTRGDGAVGANVTQRVRALCPALLTRPLHSTEAGEAGSAWERALHAAVSAELLPLQQALVRVVWAMTVDASEEEPSYAALSGQDLFSYLPLHQQGEVLAAAAAWQRKALELPPPNQGGALKNSWDEWEGYLDAMSQPLTFAEFASLTRGQAPAQEEDSMWNGTCEVRGELLLHDDEFKRINARDSASSEAPAYNSPRNLIVGLLGRDELPVRDDTHLHSTEAGTPWDIAHPVPSAPSVRAIFVGYGLAFREDADLAAGATASDMLGGGVNDAAVKASAALGAGAAAEVVGMLAAEAAMASATSIASANAILETIAAAASSSSSSTEDLSVQRRLLARATASLLTHPTRLSFLRACGVPTDPFATAIALPPLAETEVADWDALEEPQAGGGVAAAGVGDLPWAGYPCVPPSVDDPVMAGSRAYSPSALVSRPFAAIPSFADSPPTGGGGAWQSHPLLPLLKLCSSLLLSVRPILPLRTDGVVLKLAEPDAIGALGAAARTIKSAIAVKLAATGGNSSSSEAAAAAAAAAGAAEEGSVDNDTAADTAITAALSSSLGTHAAVTRLLSVSMQVGRSGKVTPVAHLAPVALGGATVARASLHNHSALLPGLEENNEEEEDSLAGLRVGERIIVERRGDIIPMVRARLPSALQPPSTRLPSSMALTDTLPRCRPPRFHSTEAGEDDVFACPCALQLPLARRAIGGASDSAARKRAAAAAAAGAVPVPASVADLAGPMNGESSFSSEDSELVLFTPHPVPGWSAALFCVSPLRCPSQSLQRVSHAASKPALDVESLSAKTLQQLRAVGLLHSSLPGLAALALDADTREALCAALNVPSPDMVLSSDGSGAFVMHEDLLPPVVSAAVLLGRYDEITGSLPAHIPSPLTTAGEDEDGEECPQSPGYTLPYVPPSLSPETPTAFNSSGIPGIRGWKQAKTHRLLRALSSSLAEQPLQRMVVALGVPSLGPAATAALLEHFEGDICRVFAATAEELGHVRGVGASLSTKSTTGKSAGTGGGDALWRGLRAAFIRDALPLALLGVPAFAPLRGMVKGTPWDDIVPTSAVSQKKVRSVPVEASSSAAASVYSPLRGLKFAITGSLSTTKATFARAVAGAVAKALTPESHTLGAVPYLVAALISATKPPSSLASPATAAAAAVAAAAASSAPVDPALIAAAAESVVAIAESVSNSASADKALSRADLASALTAAGATVGSGVGRDTTALVVGGASTQVRASSKTTAAAKMGVMLMSEWELVQKVLDAKRQ